MENEEKEMEVAEVVWNNHVVLRKVYLKFP